MVLQYFMIGILPFLCYFLYLIAWQYYTRWRLPPGPPPWPILGNINLLKCSDEHPSKLIAELSAKYGDPITLWFGLVPAVIFNSYGSVKRTFLQHPNAFLNRPQTMLGRVFTENSECKSGIIFSSHGEQWKAARRNANSAMRKVVNSHSLSSFVSEAAETMLKSLWIESEEGSNPVKPATFLQNMVFNIIAYAVFECRLDIYDEEYRKLLKAQHDISYGFKKSACVELFPTMLHSILKRLPIVTRFYAGIQNQRDFISKYFDLSISNFDPGADPTNISQAMVVDTHKIDQKEAIQILVDIFQAGNETTTLALRWFILEMVLHPQIQEDCYEEIMSVTENGKRQVTLSDREYTPLLKATIQEVLRHHNPQALGIPHVSHTPVTVDQYTYTEHCQLYINHYAVLHDATHFAEPQSFRPQRFIEKQPDGRTTVLNPPALIPFGVGKRVCLGERLALNDLFLSAAAILQSLQFSAVEGEEYSELPSRHHLLEAIPVKEHRYYIRQRNMR